MRLTSYPIGTETKRTRMRVTKHLNCFAAILGLAVSASASRAENWTQFRGSEQNGVAATECPVQWSDSSNVRWKVELAGEGWSAPIVWEQSVFVTAAVPVEETLKEAARPEEYSGGGGRRRDDLTETVYRYEVICLDVNSGKERWRKIVREGKPPIPRHSTNTYATETPITDGKHVYAYFGMSGLYCLDMDGNLVWEKDLGVYPMRAGWGTSSSPVLFNDKLFLQIDNEAESFIAAVSAKTGEVIWKVARPEKSQYSSPYIWQNSQRNEVIAGGMVYRSYDPETGKLLWELDMAKGRSSATPVSIGDRLYVGTELRTRGDEDDGGGFLFSIKPGGAGDITPADDATSSEFVEWKIDRSDIQMASPTVCQGHLYFLERQSGNLHCINAETGKTAYRKRITGARAFWASPWSAGDKVYCIDSSGTTFVIAGGPEYKLLSSNPLDEQIWASAAVADGAAFLRTVTKLYCIAEGA